MKTFYVIIFILDILLTLFIYLRLIKGNLLIESKYLILPLIILGFMPIIYNLSMKMTLHPGINFLISFLYGAFIILILGSLLSFLISIPLHLIEYKFPIPHFIKFYMHLFYFIFMICYGCFSFYFAKIVPPEIVKVDLKIEGKNIPSSGIKIVQLSDMHVTPFIGKENTKLIVSKVNELSPDYIFITGDLIDAPPKQILEDLAPLKDLIAKKGIYYVLGNHEYYRDVVESVEVIKKFSNIKVLLNDFSISDNFLILGLNDRTGENDIYAPNPEKLLELINDKKYESFLKILLLHQPKQFSPFKNKVDLAFAGHTHGGQIYPFNFLAKRFNDNFLEGLYSFTKDGIKTYFYVNRGTGFWGPPLRFPNPREITLMTLH